MLTDLWNLKDIQNSRQNRSKNRLVCENAVTRAHGSCSLRVMGSCLGKDRLFGATHVNRSGLFASLGNSLTEIFAKSSL